DPLLPYGAKDGLMPSRTVEDTLLLRKALMRWQYPHVNYCWRTLEEGVREIAVLQVTTSDLVSFVTEDGVVLYTLSADVLERIAQLALALNQVLTSLYSFLNPNRSQVFNLEPGWQLLRLMEENLSRHTILSAFLGLRYRMTQAVKHVKRQLNSIKRVYHLENLDDVSSVNSTLSSVRAAFGQGTPETELGKLLTRPDYGALV
ncbi:hypothetical protein B0H12DRAFT_970707, partial [Mycena haematopus]